MDYRRLALALAAQLGVFAAGALAWLAFTRGLYASAILCALSGVVLASLGLTATAFITRKDFSFLRGVLVVGSFVAFGVIICSMIFQFDLGLIFSGAMVLFAGCSILYTTSNIMHHYRTDQHVAAALALFAGVMLLLWYVLRIVMSRR